MAFWPRRPRFDPHKSHLFFTFFSTLIKKNTIFLLYYTLRSYQTHKIRVSRFFTDWLTVKTYFHNLVTNSWIDGPDMLHKRSLHACQKMGSMLIVAGGGRGSETQFVEYLDYQNLEIGWRMMAPLPLESPLMIPALDEKSLFLLSQSFRNGFHEAIYQLKCDSNVMSNCAWIPLYKKKDLKGDDFISYEPLDQISDFSAFAITDEMARGFCN